MRADASFPFLDDAQVGRGWRNGDVNYNPRGGWFAVFFAGEEESQAYDDQLNMGRLADGAVETLASVSDVSVVEIRKA